jgi:cupin fold WbuC family metalloprotein
MKLFSTTLLDELTARAAASPRLRAHHNVHSSPGDPVQRFFVCAQRDTYFRPHRHLTKSEMALVLRGEFDILTFDDHGTVTGRYRIGAESADIGFEMPHATWHTLLANVDGAAFLEIKEGPYDPAQAAEFASWAPAEGDGSVPAFQRWMRSAPSGGTPPGPGAQGARGAVDRVPPPRAR